jgi:hypothetical protein
LSLRKRIRRWLRARRLERAFRDADAILVSFPKCGRTWLRVLIGAALCRHFGVERRELLLLEPGTEPPDPGVPRIFVHHDDGAFWKRPEELTASKRAYAGKRVILLVRDAHDVLVSAWFHKRKRRQRGDPGPLADYLRSEVGSLATFVRFHQIWAEARGVPADFLLVRYEDLHRDAAGELARVLAFLGVKDVSAATLAHAVDFAGFDHLHALESSGALDSRRLAPADPDDPDSFKTRVGRVGGWREHFAPDDARFVADGMRGLPALYGYSAG